MPNANGKYPDSSTAGAIEAYTGSENELFSYDLKTKFYADVNSTATRDGTSVLNRAGGGRWLALAGGGAPGFQGSYALEAAQVLGTSKMNTWMLDFINGVDDVAQSLDTNGTQTIVGDSTDPVNAIGGVLRMGTSVVNVAVNNQVLPHVSGSFAPMCGFNTPAIKFYRAARMRIFSTPDANTLCWAGSPGWRMGVIGSNSTTKYSLQIKSSSPSFITSTISIDTAFHIFATYHDGVNAWFRVDNEAWQSLPDLALFPLSAADNSYWNVVCGKVTGAVNHLLDVDWGFWAVSPT